MAGGGSDHEHVGQPESATQNRVIAQFRDELSYRPRAHQYFGIKAAQARAREKKGGIIWHTQGSGKSIVMVLLAKWTLENNPNLR